MSQLTKITSAMLASSLSTVLLMSPALAATGNDVGPVTNGVSQKINSDKAASKATAESLNSYYQPLSIRQRDYQNLQKK